MGKKDNSQNPLDLLTVAEAGAYLRLTANAVRVRCKRGQFPNALRLRAGRGWSWRIPRQDVLAQLEIPGIPAADPVPASPTAHLTVEEKRRRWPALAEHGIV